MRKLMLLASFAFILAVPTKVIAADYYFDSSGGNDTSSGTSLSTPWKSLSKINSTNYSAGDNIYLKRGSSWNGNLIINRSGNSSNPINFKPYSTGNRPSFSSSGTDAISINGDYIVLEGVLVTNANEAGVRINSGADHNVVRDIEATNVGIGVWIFGRYNLVTESYLHDLKMVRNTQGGDDDFGAIGVSLINDDNEISYNRIENCIAPSYDYGTDGGAVEIYDNASRSKIHHNYANNTDGFLEAGSGGGGSANDLEIYYNVAINSKRFTGLHVGGNFGINFNNVRVYNNTIIQTASSGDATINFWNGTPGNASNYVFRNNIVYSNKPGANNSVFTHDHNIFYLTNGASLGFSLNSTDKTGNPKFVNLASGDFHLQDGSPAINAGVSSNYNIDFAGSSVPVGSAPDIGAYEYGGTGSPIPSITPTSTPLVKPGDANSDGQVNGLDYVIWLKHFNLSTSQGISVGDFNNSGSVDGLDYVIWLTGFGG